MQIPNLPAILLTLLPSLSLCSTPAPTLPAPPPEVSRVLVTVVATEPVDPSITAPGLFAHVAEDFIDDKTAKTNTSVVFPTETHTRTGTGPPGPTPPATEDCWGHCALKCSNQGSEGVEHCYYGCKFANVTSCLKKSPGKTTMPPEDIPTNTSSAGQHPPTPGRNRWSGGARQRTAQGDEAVASCDPGCTAAVGARECWSEDAGLTTGPPAAAAAVASRLPLATALRTVVLPRTRDGGDTVPGGGRVLVSVAA